MLDLPTHVAVSSAGIKVMVHVAWITSELIGHAGPTRMLWSRVLLARGLWVRIRHTCVMGLRVFIATVYVSLTAHMTSVKVGAGAHTHGPGRLWATGRIYLCIGVRLKNL